MQSRKMHTSTQGYTLKTILRNLQSFWLREWRFILPLLFPFAIGAAAWGFSSFVRNHINVFLSIVWWRVLSLRGMLVFIPAGLVYIFILLRMRNRFNPRIRRIGVFLVLGAVLSWAVYLGLKNETDYPGFWKIGIAGFWKVTPEGHLQKCRIGYEVRSSIKDALAQEEYDTMKLIFHRLEPKDVGIHCHQYATKSLEGYRQYLKEFAQESRYLMIIWGTVAPSDDHISYEVLIPGLTRKNPDGHGLSRTFTSLSQNQRISPLQQARIIAKTIATIYEKSGSDHCPPPIALASNRSSAKKLDELRLMLRESIGSSPDQDDGFALFLKVWEHEIHSSNCRAWMRAKDYHSAAKEAYQALSSIFYSDATDWRSYLRAYSNEWKASVGHDIHNIPPERPPDDVSDAYSAWEYLSITVSKSDQFESDIKLFDRLAEKAPQDPVPLMHKATAYSYHLDPEKSIEIYKNLMKKYPDIEIFKVKAAGAYVGYGQSLQASGNDSDAEKAKEKAYRLLVEGWPALLKSLEVHEIQ